MYSCLVLWKILFTDCNEKLRLFHKVVSHDLIVAVSSFIPLLFICHYTNHFSASGLCGKRLSRTVMGMVMKMLLVQLAISQPIL